MAGASSDVWLLSEQQRWCQSAEGAEGADQLEVPRTSSSRCSLGSDQQEGADVCAG